MAARTYICALTAVIEVDDATLTAAALGCRVDEATRLLPAVEPQTLQHLLDATNEMPPERRLQYYLVNRFFDEVHDLVPAALERALPGAGVLVVGIHAEAADGEIIEQDPPENA